MMSRQDKDTTERHARMLRELVKRPENKFCADCKHNDPRWASWNLGVFLCIRCSGIHRGMGTHISRVKSIDLDTWTSDQMKSIQDWGNRRANLYWEAHLKTGHVPPDHKMESFIRSKYESRRWAMDGPPPSDPSVLDDDSISAGHIQKESPAVSSSPHPTHILDNNLSGRRLAPPVVSSPITTQPQPHQLLSTALADQSHQPQPPIAPASCVPAQPQQTPLGDSLFSLDFHPPASSSAADNLTAHSKKDVKQDILSLFSAPPPAAAGSAFGPFYAGPVRQSSWDHFGDPQPQQVAQPINTSGITAWGASPGWNISTEGQGMSWGDPSQQQQARHSGTGNIWESTNIGSFLTSGGLLGASTEKKDDVFGDLWGSGL